MGDTDDRALSRQSSPPRLNWPRAARTARARQAIRTRRDRLIPAMQQLVPPLLENADCDDCRRLAELLAHIQAWELLGELTQRALACADPDLREVGQDFTSSYGPLWQAH